MADTTTFYQLCEGKRGLFLGGSETVYVSRLLGPDRMTEMMLTGRKIDAAQGQRLRLSHSLVPEGQSLAKALKLAEQVAPNAPSANDGVAHGDARLGGLPQ